MRTRVGYAGGTSPSPTYARIGDHTEAVQIDYDPAVLTYETLLDVFWKDHDPTAKPWSRQYMSIIFFHDDGQRRLAEATMAVEARRRGARIRTELLPYTGFELAEAYHQKYYLRREKDLFEIFERAYPDPAGLAASTAAARVNGYLGGYGDPGISAGALERLGLSAEAGRKLLDVFAWRRN